MKRFCAILFMISSMTPPAFSGEWDDYLHMLSTAAPSRDLDVAETVEGVGYSRILSDFLHLSQYIGIDPGIDIESLQTWRYYQPGFAIRKLIFSIENILSSSGIDLENIDFYVIGGSNEGIFHVAKQIGGKKLKPSQFHLINISSGLVKINNEKVRMERDQYLKRAIQPSVQSGRKIVLLDSYVYGETLSEISKAIVHSFPEHPEVIHNIIPVGISENEYASSIKGRFYPRWNDFQQYLSSLTPEQLLTKDYFPILTTAPISNQELMVNVKRRYFASFPFNEMKNGEPSFSKFHTISPELLLTKTVDQMITQHELSTLDASLLRHRIFVVLKSYQLASTMKRFSDGTVKNLFELLGEACQTLDAYHALLEIQKEGFFKRFSPNDPLWANYRQFFQEKLENLKKERLNGKVSERQVTALFNSAFRFSNGAADQVVGEALLSTEIADLVLHAFRLAEEVDFNYPKYMLTQGILDYAFSVMNYLDPPSPHTLDLERMRETLRQYPHLVRMLHEAKPRLEKGYYINNQITARLKSFISHVDCLVTLDP